MEWARETYQVGYSEDAGEGAQPKHQPPRGRGHGVH